MCDTNSQKSVHSDQCGVGIQYGGHLNVANDLNGAHRQSVHMQAQN